jgi:hypothetical protein
MTISVYYPDQRMAGLKQFFAQGCKRNWGLASSFALNGKGERE